MKDFLKKNSKAVIWGSAIFVVILGLALGGYFYYQNYVKNKDIVAVYNGENITKSDYEKELEQCRAGMSYDNKDTDLGGCDKKALEDIIYYKALKQEATKYDTDVSAEVEKSYADLVATYENEGTFLNTYKTNFGLSPDDIKRNLEVTALETALSNSLIAKKYVIGLFARYDVFQEEVGLEQAKMDATDIVSNHLSSPLKNGATIGQLQTLLETVRTDNPKYNNETKTHVGLVEIFDLNEGNYSKYFPLENDVDWNNIKNLNNVGDATAVFESPKGDVVIYRLEEKNNATFNSWDDFKADAVSRSKKYSFGYKISEIMVSLENYVSKAYAACYVHMSGYNVSSVVYKGTSTHATNIRATFAQTAGYATSGCTIGCPSGKCSGSYDYSNDNFLIGDNSDALNCNTRWNVTVSSIDSKFYDTAYINRGFDSNGVNQNIDHPLEGHDAYAQYFNGSGWVRVDSNSDDLGNDNGGIYVVPVPVVTHTITPSADTGCSISPNTVQTVTAGNSSAFTGSAEVGYTYSGFSIDGGATTAGSSYTFSNVTTSHTIKAKCSQNTYTITPSTDAGCSISPNTVQTVTHGSSKSFTGSADAGYIFNGFSKDGGATTSDGSFSNVITSHTITAKCTAMHLSCTVTPDNGLSPLVVKIETSTNIPSPILTYNYGDGTTAQRGTPVYYTYETAGAYSVTVSEPRYRGGAAQPCTPPTVNVSSPSNNETGEVAP